jgi:hypothetical protein
MRRTRSVRADQTSTVVSGSGPSEPVVSEFWRARYSWHRIRISRSLGRGMATGALPEGNCRRNPRVAKSVGCRRAGRPWCWAGRSCWSTPPPRSARSSTGLSSRSAPVAGIGLQACRSVRTCGGVNAAWSPGSAGRRVIEAPEEVAALWAGTVCRLLSWSAESAAA